MNDRARIQLTDAIAAAGVVAAAAATAQLYYDVMEPIIEGAGPLTSMLATLVVPSIMLGIIISIGVSATRRER